MGSIFCSKCGVESPEDEGFCSKCGTALFKPKATVPPAEPPATDSPEVTPKKKVTFQVVPALIVFGVVIVFTFGWAYRVQRRTANDLYPSHSITV